jgi:hypothetical protein
LLSVKYVQLKKLQSLKDNKSTDENNPIGQFIICFGNLFRVKLPKFRQGYEPKFLTTKLVETQRREFSEVF